MQLLQLLQAVSLDANSHRFADDGMQIDEDATSQEPVQLLAASLVPRANALQSRRLVRAEVIDVQARMLFPAFGREIDESLARGFLLGRAERPML